MGTTPLLASGLPAVSVHEFTDPIAIGREFELASLKAVQLQSNPLRVRSVIVRLGNAAVSYHSTHQRVRTRTVLHGGLLGYLAFGPQTTGSVNGIAARPERLLAVEPAVQLRFVAEAGWESIAFLLRSDFMRAHLGARQRAEEHCMPRGLRTLCADATKAQALFGWGRRLVASATRDPASFNDSAHRRAAAQVELIEALLDALREAADHAPDPGERARQEQSRIVKVAEDHALAHLGEQLYVSDLCRVTGVSERSLEYAFKQTLGLTPVAYLTRLRLHRVRDLLLGPGQRPQTVSAVALEGGFWHFGEFSRAYKACFGESPSQTLRRRRLQPGSDHAAPQFGA